MSYNRYHNISIINKYDLFQFYIIITYITSALPYTRMYVACGYTISNRRLCLLCNKFQNYRYKLEATFIVHWLAWLVSLKFKVLSL